VVTSRGCNYSENAKAYLESPAGTTRYECGITLSDNAGRCGMLVKSGAPTLEITSANSTIDGGYAVEGGALKLGVVPGSAVPVRVASGATLNLNNKGTLTASTFEGAGSVTNGNVTVTGAIKMTCADIFTGHAATFGGDLTIANGAVFEITDAENLVGYKSAGHVVVLTAGGTIEHVPSVRFRKSDGTQASVNGSWSLRLSADGKSLRFGYVKGFVISVR
jgi:autotransporter-associated beta strand protein